MGNVCSNDSATAVGPPQQQVGPARNNKRSVIGNAVHNVKKKMGAKNKWDNSQPESTPVRKNHRQIDDYTDAQKLRPKDRDRLEPRQRNEEKQRYHKGGDGVPMDYSPESGIHAADGGGRGPPGGGGRGDGRSGGEPFGEVSGMDFAHASFSAAGF